MAMTRPQMSEISFICSIVVQRKYLWKIKTKIVYETALCRVPILTHHSKYIKKVKAVFSCFLPAPSEDLEFWIWQLGKYLIQLFSHTLSISFHFHSDSQIFLESGFANPNPYKSMDSQDESTGLRTSYMNPATLQFFQSK